MKLFSVLIFSFSLKAYSAACCGGGFATPSVIAGDDKAQLTTSISVMRTDVDYVDPSGVWYKRNQKESARTLKIEGAHIFLDRWQVGFSIPVVQKSRQDEQSSGLSDISANMGYEFLPDWDYNPYRPKGIGYVQLILPTGKNINEDDSTMKTDSRGKGFWSLGAGTLFTKTWSRLDAFMGFDLHRSFEKSFRNNLYGGQLKPGWGGNFSLGLGYNTSDWRYGGSLTWNYEDPLDVSGSINSRSAPERYTTATLAASYRANDQWASTVSYSDQTVVGKPSNTSLGKSLTLQLQRRWAR